MGKYLIPYAYPYITEEDAIAVYNAVRERKLSQGSYVASFEEKFGRYVGGKHAIATINGTAALHLALTAIGVGEGDEVLVPSFSFIATANVVLYQRAKPVFVDIDPLTLNIDPGDARRKITDKTKAIIVVHYAGHPAEMDEFMELAEEKGLFIIEDAAEAHGSIYKGRVTGSIGHLGCFSFYPNKNMTTGEGGMVTTNYSDLAEKIRRLRSQGQDGVFHHVVLGYNYKMTDIQAALGIVQLRRIEWVISEKIRIAEYYTEKIEEKCGDKIAPPYVAPYVRHTYMFYTIKFHGGSLRNKAIKLFNERGVETRKAYDPPIHLQPLYRSLYGYRPGLLKNTEDASRRVLSIPIFVGLSRKQQDYILDVLEEIAGEN